MQTGVRVETHTSHYSPYMSLLCRIIGLKTGFKSTAIIRTSNTCQLGFYSFLIICVIHLCGTECFRSDTSSRSTVTLPRSLFRQGYLATTAVFKHLQEVCPCTYRTCGNKLTFTEIMLKHQKQRRAAISF